MSLLNVVIVENGNIHMKQMHYRELMEFFYKNRFNLLKDMESKRYLDAGYVLVDFNKKILMNNQNCFSLDQINPKLRDILNQRWLLFEF